MPECLFFMSALFPISGITILQHMDAPEHCQHCFPFSALQVFSIRMHLNIVGSISNSGHYKPSTSHAGELVYLSRFAHLILQLCYLDFKVPCSPNPFRLQYLMRGRGSTYQGSRIRSCGLNMGESLIDSVLHLPSYGEYLKRKKYSPIMAGYLTPANCFIITSFYTFLS